MSSVTSTRIYIFWQRHSKRSDGHTDTYERLLAYKGNRKTITEKKNNIEEKTTGYKYCTVISKTLKIVLEIMKILQLSKKKTFNNKLKIFHT